MDIDDKHYLLKKYRYELTNDIRIFEERMHMYTNMLNTLSNFDMRNWQERFLLSDLQRLIAFFESKVYVLKIKLRDIDSALEK
jgi:conjugal transfer/entry exclusion protein